MILILKIFNKALIPSLSINKEGTEGEVNLTDLKEITCLTESLTRCLSEGEKFLNDLNKEFRITLSDTKITNSKENSILNKENLPYLTFKEGRDYKEYLNNASKR